MTAAAEADHTSKNNNIAVNGLSKKVSEEKLCFFFLASPEKGAWKFFLPSFRLAVIDFFVRVDDKEGKSW